MPKIQKPETTVMSLNTAESPGKNEILGLHNDDDQRRKPTFLFSIDYILNKAGETNNENDTDNQNSQHYDWLNCTRFKPPKLDSKYNESKLSSKVLPKVRNINYYYLNLLVLI